jgi:lipid II:glycine glycyltransferase (peptidoglycan interpeptide bridge formation enzyme)
MKFFLEDRLDKDIQEQVLRFFATLKFYCVEQHPDFNCEYEGSRLKYFYCIGDSGRIECFSKIVILKRGPFKTATINFGPAFEDYMILNESIRFLHNTFLVNGYSFLSIQLGIYINDKTELLEYKVNKDFRISYYFTPENVWSSVFVDLTKPEDEIFKSFCSAHKSNIKSAIKKGLKIIIQKEKNDISPFVELYVRMLEFRKISFSRSEIIKSYTEIFRFINNNNQGFFVSIFDKDILVGEFMVVFQGNVARYFKSASNPERRDLSILHLGLFEAMKYSKELGYLAFDLWGYNHLIDEGNQINNINNFKKGFTNNFTFFPKQMNFELRPVIFKVFSLLRFLKKSIKRRSVHL